MDVEQEKVLFGLPADPELLLAALAAVQDYGFALQQRKNWKLGIYSPNPELDFLRPCFPAGTVFMERWQPRRGEWDYVCKVDTDAALEVGQGIDSTAALSIGVLMGAAPRTELPDLSKLKFKGGFSEVEVIVLDTVEEEMVELVELNHPELRVQRLDYAHTLEDRTDRIQAAEVVIGQRSFETYIAAALGKVVVELYSADQPQKWLSKWAGKYQMLYGDHFPTGLIYKAFDEVTNRWPIPTTQMI